VKFSVLRNDKAKGMVNMARKRKKKSTTPGGIPSSTERKVKNKYLITKAEILIQSC